MLRCFQGLHRHERLAAAALLLAVLLASWLSLSPLLSLDIWWHLKTGELILRDGRIPTTDPFTHTAPGSPWVTHEWLAGVLFFLLHRAGGADLLVLCQAFLAGAAIALGAAAALVGGGGRARLAAVAAGALLAAPLIAPRAFPRPHMFSAVMLGMTLLLLRLEASSGRRLWRLALVPLFLLWANLHSGFVLGLGLIALFWIGEAIQRRWGGIPPGPPAPWRARLWTLLAVGLATLVNPHHIEAALYPLRLMAREEVRSAIIELRSSLHPAYRGAFFLYALLAVAILLGLAQAGGPRRPRAQRWVMPVLLPGLVFGALALRNVRGLSEFAVLVPALLGLHGAWLARHRRATTAAALAVAALALGGGAAALRWGVPMGETPPRRVGLGVDRTNLPEDAVRFLRAVHPGGRMFNLLGPGGYLIHELWPEQRVYIDGRLDVFPHGFLDAYGRLLRTGEGWEQACRAYDLTLAVLGYPHESGREAPAGLWGVLREDPDWACVYFGDRTIVYARRVPENEALLARFACPFDPSRRDIASIWAFAARAPAEDRAQAEAAIEAMLAITPEERAPWIALGVLRDATGRGAEAAEALRRACALDPDDGSARLLLAGALKRAGLLVEAREALRPLLERDPRDVEALIVQADIERGAGDLSGAARTLARAESLAPEHVNVQLCLGLVLAEQGDRAGAERHYRRALALRPGDPSALRGLERLPPSR